MLPYHMVSFSTYRHMFIYHTWLIVILRMKYFSHCVFSLCYLNKDLLYTSAIQQTQVE